MKQIINGKMYDTEKAECILTMHNGSPTIYIYMTNNGAFFAERGYNLDIVSKESVKNFLGRYDIDKYIELFGEPEEA